MTRESMQRGRVAWSGRPRIVSAPTSARVGALVLGLIAAVTTSFAIVVATVLEAPVGSLLVFGAWCGTLALAVGYGPSIWRSELEYFVTEEQVIYQRGPFRRTISRRDISYARIHWHPSLVGVGDLELVRAVPTGALRRRLALTLPGLDSPDEVLALIRGAENLEARDENLLLAQKLEEGERVLWSGRPVGAIRDYLPSEPRDFGTAALALLVVLMLERQLSVAIPVTKQALGAGVPFHSLSFIALLSAFGLTSLLLAGVALGLGYVALLRPARRFSQTRYLITDRRVLIQRGREELSLDRSRIVDLIDRPRRRGSHDIFLVLDGPRARALATSGAFGQRSRKDSLLPVLRAISEPSIISEILREPSLAEQPPEAAMAADEG